MVCLGVERYLHLLDFCGRNPREVKELRSDVEGVGRKRLLVTSGVGFHSKKKGERKRKSIRGNTISKSISQINTKVVTYGSKPIEKLISKKEEAPKEEKKEEPKVKEEVKETPKEEAKPEAKEEPKAEPAKEEKPKEEPKAEK